MSEPLIASIALVISEIVRGKALSFSQAGKLIPALRGESSTNPATIWRWARRGHKLDDGTVVKLECAKVAGRWLTSVGSVTRFIERVTLASNPKPTDSPSLKPARSSKAQSEASRRASAKLRALGA
jgi:hypothetical protein